MKITTLTMKTEIDRIDSGNDNGNDIDKENVNDNYYI